MGRFHTHTHTHTHLYIYLILQSTNLYYFVSYSGHLVKYVHNNGASAELILLLNLNSRGKKTKPLHLFTFPSCCFKHLHPTSEVDSKGKAGPGWEIWHTAELSL